MTTVSKIRLAGVSDVLAAAAQSSLDLKPHVQDDPDLIKRLPSY